MGTRQTIATSMQASTTGSSNQHRPTRTHPTHPPKKKTTAKLTPPKKTKLQQPSNSQKVLEHIAPKQKNI